MIREAFPKAATHRMPSMSADTTGEPLVLIVDDEESLLEELADGLTCLGLTVACAGNSRDALETLRRHPSVHVVITDIRMSGGSGIDLTRNVRNLSDQPPVEVIVMTAHGTPDDIAAASNAGANAILLKPFRLNDIRTAVTEAIARTSHARQLEAR